jgi:hypothetical protein
VRQAVIEKECGSGKTRRGVFAFARFEALNLDDGFGSLSLSLSLSRWSKVPSTLHSSRLHSTLTSHLSVIETFTPGLRFTTTVTKPNQQHSEESSSSKANPLQPRYLRTSIHISSRSTKKKKTPNAHARHPWPHGRYQVLSGIFHRSHPRSPFHQKVINHACPAPHLKPLTW